MGDTELGARLRQARENKGIKQADVCQEIGIPKVQTLSAYERGVNNPPLDTLKELARLYQITTDELLFGQSAYYQPPKNEKDYVVQLVDAVDSLRLPLNAVSSDYPWGYPQCNINLTGRFSLQNHQVYLSFVEKWRKLRNLLDTNTIEKSEYDILIAQRLSELDTLHLFDFDDVLPF